MKTSTKAYLHLIGILVCMYSVWWMTINHPKLMILISGLMIAVYQDIEWTNPAHFPSYLFTLLILGAYEYLASLRPFIADLAVAVPVYMFTGIFLALNLVELTAQLKYVRED
jgi:hypothetical protein